MSDTKDWKVKPIIILPPGVMQDADIQLLRDNGLCVVTAEDPGKVRFLDPIPAAEKRGQMEEAAIALSRKVLRASGVISRSDAAGFFVDAITKGTPLGADSEIYERAFDEAKLEQARELGREEARAERAAKKAKQKPADK